MIHWTEIYICKSEDILPNVSVLVFMLPQENFNGALANFGISHEMGYQPSFLSKAAGEF